MDWRQEKPSQRIQLEGSIQSPGAGQREPILGSGRKNKDVSQNFVVRITLELVVPYDFAFFSCYFFSFLGAKIVSD